MPALNLTFAANSAHEARIMAAYGRLLFPNENRDATPAEVKAEFIRQLLGAVVQYEKQQAISSLPPTPPLTIT